jgi:pyruvate, water dikinase
MAIIQKKLGAKEKTMVYAGSNGHASTMNMDTEPKKQDQFVLKRPGNPGFGQMGT